LQLRSSSGWLILALIGCGSDDDDAQSLDGSPALFAPEGRDTASGAGGGSASPGGASSAGNDGSSVGNGAVAVPEQEEENTFRVPVVTGRLIWAANPVSGRVALVDALTHEVQTLPAG